ncbi:glyoxalase [Nocardia brasiliensis]|uniref:Glyoxalase n=1 Tax=Nocardia brasiliensis TaxID=37326 RepID=A0A6G9XTK4_NOCBR|nr:VOC family protein [Nocardia brasiliensis]QIS04180.1 glyoxalase [Nocardia brasiliensis]
MINVPDPDASAKFMIEHLDFTETITDDGLAVIFSNAADLHLAFLRVGAPDFRPESVAGALDKGMIIVLVVTDVDAEHARLQEAGVEIVTPLGFSKWEGSSGERYFQMRDPNGLIVRLTEWV